MQRAVGRASVAGGGACARTRIEARARAIVTCAVTTLNCSVSIYIVYTPHYSNTGDAHIVYVRGGARRRPVSNTLIRAYIVCILL